MSFSSNEKAHGEIQTTKVMTRTTDLFADVARIGNKISSKQGKANGKFITVVLAILASVVYAISAFAPVQQKAEAVWLSHSRTIYYCAPTHYKMYTSDFTVDGRTAYCAIPKNASPGNGSYGASGYYNDMMAAILYYGPGGPGYYYAKDNGYWPSRDCRGNVMTWDDYYCAAHVMISYVFGSDALYGTCDTYRSWANSNLFGWVWNNLSAHTGDVPQAFKNGVRAVYTGRGEQDIMYFADYVEAGGIRLHKYDGSYGGAMAGVTFDIYNSNQYGSKGSRVASITTNSYGDAATRINQLPLGWYLISERNAPSGYERCNDILTKVTHNFTYNNYDPRDGNTWGGWNVPNWAYIEKTFTKKWRGTPGDLVSFDIYQNGSFYKTYTHQLSASEYPDLLSRPTEWQYSFTLPKFTSTGQIATYTVKERNVSNGCISQEGRKYKVEYAGDTMVNIELRNYTIKKQWEDNDNAYGYRPSEITVQLKRNVGGTITVVDTVKLNETNNWQYTWADLPIGSATYDYSFIYQAEEVTGGTIGRTYIPSGSPATFAGIYASENTITNRLDTISIPIEKRWVGDNTRPSGVVVKLMNGDAEIDRVVLNSSYSDGCVWKYTFENVPKYDGNGNEISYTLEEEPVSGYEGNFSKAYDEETDSYVYKLLNVSTETTKVSVNKIWSDSNDPAGAGANRPSSVNVQLYRNGITVGEPQTLSAGNSWSYSFTGLRKYDKNGNLNTYTIEEEAVSRYAWEVITNASPVGEPNTVSYTIKNSFGVTSVPVTKVWSNENGNTSRRPSSIIVRLLADGVADGHTLTLNSGNSWKGTFTNLRQYNDDGEEIVYSVIEDSVGFYTTSITGNQAIGYTITNKYSENETAIPVTKQWIDNSNASGLRPASVTAVLNQQKHNGAQKLTLTTNPTSGTYAVYKKENVTIDQNKFYIGVWNTNTNRPYSGNGGVYALIKQTANAVINYSNMGDAGSTNSYGLFNQFDLSVYNAIAMHDGYMNCTVPYIVTEYLPPNYNPVNKTAAASILRNNGLLYLSNEPSQPTASYWYPSSVYVTGSTGYLIFRASSDVEYMIADHLDTGTTYPSTLRKITSLNNTTWYSGGTSYSYGRNNNSGSIYFNVPQGGSSFYPTATASARHALSFYYTNSGTSAVAVTVKMAARGGTASDAYWNAGSVFATFNAQPGTHYYTLVQNSTNSYSGTVRLDFLNSSAANLNGNVTDLSMWNTASGVTTSSTGRTVTLSAANNWTASFEGLPRFDASTNAIIEYTVSENPVPNYTGSVTGTGNVPIYSTANKLTQNPSYSFQIKNTEGDIYNVPVTKIWGDYDDAFGYRPQSVTINLYANGSFLRSLELNENNEWKGVFDNLPAANLSGSIVYTISEANRPAYYDVPIISGDVNSEWFVTNNLSMVNIPVDKEWKDSGDAAGKRTESVTIHLLANGVDTGKQLILNSANSWEGTFENLTKLDASGNSITYTLTEDDVDGYNKIITQPDSNGQNAHVKNELRTKDVPVSKSWVVPDIAMIPDSIQVKLTSDKTALGATEQTITLTKANEWQGTFTNVRVYDNNGDEIDYRVEEVGSSFDASAFNTISNGDYISGFHITNTALIDIPVTKFWEDSDDADELRPSSVTVRLYRGNEPTGDVLTLTEANNWSGVFTEVEYSNDDDDDYSVREDAVTGYELVSNSGTAVFGFNLTNYHKRIYTEIPVQKIWDDGNNQDGIRPTSITVRLMQTLNQSDTPVAITTMTLTEANGWKGTFSGAIPIEDEYGHEYSYTVEEDSVDGYTSVVGRSVEGTIYITNTHTPQTRDISVEKQWYAPDNEDKIPSSITLHLLRDGIDMNQNAVVTPNGSGEWKYTYEGLPITDGAGREYIYTVTEEPVTGFAPVIGGDMEHGWVIINRYVLTDVPIAGIKTWVGDNPADRPDSITVRLMRESASTELEEVARQTITPDALGKWGFDFGNQPQFPEGAVDSSDEYIYTIEELPVDGYKATYGLNIYGTYTITNYPTKKIEVEKVWNDNDDTDSRPNDINVDLMTTRFTNANVLSYDEGNDYVYYGRPAGENFVATLLFNVPVDDFTIEIRNASDNSLVRRVNANGGNTIAQFDVNVGNISSSDVYFKMYNSSSVDITSNVSLFKIHDDKTVQLLVETKALNEDNDWKTEFRNLSEIDQHGFPQSFSVKECDVYGYTSAVTGNEEDGFVITNTKSDEIDVVKTWDDEGYESLRPSQVTVALSKINADNSLTQVKTMTLSSADNWEGTFTGITWRDPATKEPIKYTIEEIGQPGYDATVSGDEMSGFTVINAPLLNVPVTKTWSGDDASDRPSSVNFSLAKTATMVSTLSHNQEREAWSAAITSLLRASVAKYGAPDEIEVEFSNSSDETTYAHISFSAGNISFPVTVAEVNAQSTTKKKVDLSAFSAASHENIKCDILPLSEYDTVLDELIADGSVTATFTAKFPGGSEELEITPQAGTWSGSFTGIPIVDEIGNRLSYVLSETDVPEGYLPNVSGNIADGYQVENVYGKTKVDVTKTWNDLDDKDGIRPESITVSLLVKDNDTDEYSATGKTLELSEENGWAGTFNKLEAKDGNNRTLEYKVEETNVPEGYICTVNGNQEDGFEIVNSHDVRTSVTIDKMWDDESNIRGIRPSFIVVHLFADGDEFSSAVVHSENGRWSVTFDDLPYVNADGNVIEYTVSEDEVNGYDLTDVLGDQKNGFKLVNWTSRPVIMPLSGAIGTLVLVMCGIVSIAVGAHLMTRRRK